MSAFNGLSASEIERLALLFEESAELIEVLSTTRTGREKEWTSSLVAELGDVMLSKEYMRVAGDLTDDEFSDELMLALLSANVDFKRNWRSVLTIHLASLQKSIGKTLRHGYESCNPFDPKRETNRILVSKGIDGVLRTAKMAASLGEFDWFECLDRMGSKSVRIKKYLHEQSVHPKI